MFSNRFRDFAGALDATVYSNRTETISEENALQRFFEVLSSLQEAKGIAYIIGNGGSAGIASHFSTDLIKGLKIPSSTLYDSNMMTCLSNDIGYDQVFSYPLGHLLKPQDLLVAISSSGKSPNIVNAAEVALRKGTPLITLSGFLNQNPLKKMGDLNFWVDRCDYGLVETTHFFLLHTVVDYWNQQSRVKQYARIIGSQTAKQS